MRRIFILPLIITLSAPLGGQTPAAVSRGTVVRLTIISEPLSGSTTRVVGLFDHAANDSIYITRIGSPQPPEYYAARSLQSLERSIGETHRYVKGGLLGALFGTAVGYGVYRVTRGPQEPQSAFHCTNTDGVLVCTDNKPPERNLTVPIGTGLGLVSGLVIARRTRSFKWEIVPMGSLR